MDKEKKSCYGQESEKAEQICHYRGCGDAGIYVCYVDRLFYYDIFFEENNNEEGRKRKKYFFSYNNACFSLFAYTSVCNVTLSFQRSFRSKYNRFSGQYYRYHHCNDMLAERVEEK